MSLISWDVKTTPCATSGRVSCSWERRRLLADVTYYVTNSGAAVAGCLVSGYLVPVGRRNGFTDPRQCSQYDVLRYIGGWKDQTGQGAAGLGSAWATEASGRGVERSMRVRWEEADPCCWLLQPSVGMGQWKGEFLRQGVTPFPALRARLRRYPIRPWLHATGRQRR
jgi:hypothetical protein